MFYHASPVEGIAVLTPHVSNHGEALTYFSTKRENTLVYLSNAVEQFCRKRGICGEGPIHKWATYGFDCAGLLVLDEYYPGATRETYEGVAGYIYTVERMEEWEWQKDVLGCVVTRARAEVSGCEYVPDAYEALVKAAEDGALILRRYEDNSERFLAWIERTVRAEFAHAAADLGYRAFLKEKFPFL